MYPVCARQLGGGSCACSGAITATALFNNDVGRCFCLRFEKEVFAYSTVPAEDLYSRCTGIGGNGGGQYIVSVRFRVRWG